MSSIADEMVTIRTITGGEDLDRMRGLLRSYNAYLSTFINPCQLNSAQLEADLAALPKGYLAPSGALLLAEVQGVPAGCLLVRELKKVTAERSAELKRLWVEPQLRGHSLGRKLLAEAIHFAQDAGYHAMFLDTVADHMASAVALYRRAGFVETERYNEQRIDGISFMRLDLLHKQAAHASI